MKTRHGRTYVAIVAALMLLGLWKGSGLAQTAAETTTQLEVRAAWNEYIRVFSAGRADIIAERVYLAPSFNLAATGLAVSMTPADTRARFEAAMATLAAQNYERTETKFANICLLNDTAAVLSAQFIRYRKDGSILGEAAGTYVFAKTLQGWRIVGQVAHSPDRIMKCGS